MGSAFPHSSRFPPDSQRREVTRDNPGIRAHAPRVACVGLHERHLARRRATHAPGEAVIDNGHRVVPVAKREHDMASDTGGAPSPGQSPRVTVSAPHATPPAPAGLEGGRRPRGKPPPAAKSP